MNELINAPSFFDKLSNFIKLCNPKPHSKNLVWDIFHIYIIFFISHATSRIIWSIFKNKSSNAMVNCRLYNSIHSNLIFSLIASSFGVQ